MLNREFPKISQYYLIMFVDRGPVCHFVVKSLGVGGKWEMQVDYLSRREVIRV